LTYENYIKARIVQFAVNEAHHHGGVNGMLAVAQVLANRVNAGWGDWDVVLNSADNYIATVQPKPDVDPRDLSFRRVLGEVDGIYHGVADDSNVNVEDDDGKHLALYYAELNRIDRRWFIDSITNQLNRHRRLATVGPLTFFA
jgi:hypothetical protein